MYNVKIVNNLAEGLGGGLYVNNADPNLDFALIALNTSSAGGGVYIRNNSDPIYKNLTVAYNFQALMAEVFILEMIQICWFQIVFFGKMETINFIFETVEMRLS